MKLSHPEDTFKPAGMPVNQRHDLIDHKFDRWHLVRPPAAPHIYIFNEHQTSDERSKSLFTLKSGVNAGPYPDLVGTSGVNLEGSPRPESSLGT